MLLNYTDIALPPEQLPVAEWAYKARYFKGNDPIGEMSVVERIVVKRF